MSGPDDRTHAEPGAETAPPITVSALEQGAVPPTLALDLAAIVPDGAFAGAAATFEATADVDAPTPTHRAPLADHPHRTPATPPLRTADEPPRRTPQRATDRPARTPIPPLRTAAEPAHTSPLPPLRTAAVPPLADRPPLTAPRRTPISRPADRPPGALDLTPSRERVPAGKLLQHAIAVLTSRGPPPSGRSLTVGKRTIELPDIVTEPVARKLLDRLAEAVEGRAPHGRTPIPGEQRLARLREARADLFDYIGPLSFDDRATLIHLDPFQTVYEAQEDLLTGITAAESATADFKPDEARKGLAAPTVEATALARQMDILELIIDDLSKSATTTTRVQAGEMGAACDKILADLPASISGRRLGFLGTMIYLRGLLNTAKVFITGGYIASSKYSRSEKVIMLLNLPTKIAEGIAATAALVGATAAMIRGDAAAASTIVARGAIFTRNMVWVGSGIQMFSGLLNLTLAAVGHQKFRRTYLTDVLYGGAGALAPAGALGQKLADRTIQRQLGRTAAELTAERLALTAALKAGTIGAAEEMGAKAAVEQITRQLARHALASRIRALAGPASFYITIAEVPIQVGTFAVADNDRLNVRGGLKSTFARVQYFVGGISQDAIGLQDILENQHLAPVLAVPRANKIHDLMKAQLADFIAEHDGPQKPGHPIPLPLLGARLRGVLAEFNGVARNDPNSVLAGVRRVFAAIRELFKDEDRLYRDELRRIDKESLFELNTAVTDPPPP